MVENEKFLVTLYKRYEKDGREVLGESTLSLSEGDDLREKLSAAWEMAGLVANPVFELPEKGLAYHSVKPSIRISRNTRFIIWIRSGMTW